MTAIPARVVHRFPARALRGIGLPAALNLVLLLAAPPGHAQAPDVAAVDRSEFPDRRWAAVSHADGALAGAGLATDPWSSAYANPALALGGGARLRASGLVLNPHRDDLRSRYREYAESDGFVAGGEAAYRTRYRGLGLVGYFAQPVYERQETQFVDFDASNPSPDGPIVRRNELVSAVRYAGLALALRLRSGIVVGAGGEAAFLEEKHSTVPQAPPVPVDTVTLDRKATGLGGSVGFLAPIRGLWALGAAYHGGGRVRYDGGGRDELPSLFLAGVRYGRTAGSLVYAGVRWLGGRTAGLGSPGQPSRTTAARHEFSGGYAYLDPAGQWTFRFGGAVSPSPGRPALRVSRYGTALGYGSEGLRLTASYSHEQETRDGGGNSSRTLYLAGVELGY